MKLVPLHQSLQGEVPPAKVPQFATTCRTRGSHCGPTREGDLDHRSVLPSRYQAQFHKPAMDNEVEHRYDPYLLYLVVAGRAIQDPILTDPSRLPTLSRDDTPPDLIIYPQILIQQHLHSQISPSYPANMHQKTNIEELLPPVVLLSEWI